MAKDDKKDDAKAELSPEEQAAKSKKKKLLFAAVGGVVLLAGLGGGIFFFMVSGGDAQEMAAKEAPAPEAADAAKAEGGKPAEGAPPQDKKPDEKKADEKKDGEKKEGAAAPDDKKDGAAAASPGDRCVTALKPFNTNLGNPLENRYIRLEIQLEHGCGPEAEEVKKRDAEIKDVIISVTRKKTREHLLGPDGMDQLRNELQTRINQQMTRKINRVFITDILIE